VLPAVEVPFSAAFLLLLLGRCVNASGSKTLNAFGECARNMGAMFCDEKWRGCRMRPVKDKSKNIDELVCVAVLTLN
jgi:hypothetical protein